MYDYVNCCYQLTSSDICAESETLCMSVCDMYRRTDGRWVGANATTWTPITSVL